MTCEYCGTTYKKDYNDVIRIESFQNPVRTIAATVAFDRYEKEMIKNDIGEFARREIASKIAEEISGLMQYQCEYLPEYMQYRITGMARIVIPKDPGTIFERR